ncbi:MAG: apolipoprotein N-acyltransferase [Planctomycetaceae bacterium]
MNDPRPVPLPVAVAAAFGGGVVCSLTFPPAELWPLAFVAASPLLWALRGASPGRRALLGLVYGLVSFGLTLYWIARFGALAWTALTLMLAASIVVFAVLVPLVRWPGHPLRSAVGVAALWTVVDAARSAWPLGGFSWGGLGLSQVDDRTLLPLATIGGVWAVTFVVVLVNVLLLESLTGGGGVWRRVGRVAICAAVVLAPVAIPFSRPNGRWLDVAAVQIDVRVPPGTGAVEEDRIVAERNIALHRTLAGQGSRPDLVLWGEGALDPGAGEDPATMAAVRGTIAEVGAPTAIGAVVNDPDGSQHTSELVFDGRGRLVDRYDKVHLVPFGEYVPWRRRLGFISAIRQIPVDRVPGPSIHTVAAPGLPPFGTPICFENAFPVIPRTMVREGASFLVVPVNNASYGFTAASDQHLQMSRMRAVETGRWIVDAAVSGVSAFIAPSGGVTARTELFQTTILRSRIQASTAETLYVRLGDWAVWLSLVLAVGIALLPRRHARTRPSPGPLPASPRALVIMPTYDERATIGEVVAGVLARPEGVDVVVVDDSSPDGTGEVVRALARDEPRLRLLERPAKSGLATAYLEGFRIALDEGYDLAVEMDSDLSHAPAELSRLLEAATRHDLVVGSRYVAGGAVTNWSKARLALSKAGNTYARWMLGVPIHDATSGYRVYRRGVLEALVARPFSTDGYGFQIELVMRADRMGFDVGEAPITFREREHGVSKLSRRIVVEALWHVTRWGMALRFGRDPTA